MRTMNKSQLIKRYLECLWSHRPRPDLGGDAIGPRHDPRGAWRGGQDRDLAEAVAAAEVPGMVQGGNPWEKPWENPWEKPWKTHGTTHGKTMKMIGKDGKIWTY